MQTQHNYNLVKNTLFAKWKEADAFPSSANEADMNFAIDILAKIALKESSREAPSTIRRKIELTPDEKICKFVTEYAFTFREACETALPFVQLGNTATKCALKNTLNDFKSVVFHFLMDESEWMDEESLNCRFGQAFGNLQALIIAKACKELQGAYLEKNELKAGYYLLWLIKKAIESTLTIPPKDTFNSESVTASLSSMMQEGSFSHIRKLLMLFLYEGPPSAASISRRFLDAAANQKFQELRFANIDLSQNTDARFLINLIGSQNPEKKLQMASQLANQTDARTAQFGKNLIDFLNAKSFTEALQPFYALQQLTPEFDTDHVKEVYLWPFAELCKNYLRSICPNFVKIFNFTPDTDVFVHGPLMIGRIGPNLLAFDLQSEKMVWCLPYKGHMRQLGSQMVLLQKDSARVELFDIKTANLHAVFDLPQPLDDVTEYDLYLPSNGLFYQVDQEMLIGGEIRSGKCSVNFHIKMPGTPLVWLGTHCGLVHDEDPTKITVVNPAGHHIIIDHFISANVSGDKLYLIEKDLNNPNHCVLTIRTLLQGNQVASPVEKKIPIPFKEAFFGHINPQEIVLFNCEHSPNKALFLNLQSNALVTYQLDFHPQKFFNTSSNTLWTWDNLLSGNVKSISSNGVQEKGVYKGGGRLVYVDEATQLLYYQDSFHK